MARPCSCARSGRARLTPLGQRLLPQLTQAFDTIEAAFAAHREEDEALLTVATTFTFANTWLAWRLGSFQVEHPDLAVRLATAEQAGRPEGGRGRRCDPRRRASRGRGWYRLELMKVDFTPMCAPSFWKRMTEQLGRPPEPADLPQPAADQPGRLLVGPLASRRRGSRPSIGRASRASGSTARRTRAMRQWADRVSCC